ncbi:IucA/IucC family protein [Streptomyces sp. NPDC005808]|uniref:IucA/IucC family protein n=1 Tax=Streptomyces sp. NPDC005808 TaxID=3364734 RepID=UPI0036D00987
MHRPPTPEAEVTLADELSVVRPCLSASYAAALPGARAAVLTRLWRALAYEPMPWVTHREAGRDGLTLRLADGRRLHGPHADPYATTAYVAEVRLDGTWHDRPDRLVTALALPHAAAFAAELGNSVASLALSRAGQPAADKEPVAGWEWEQRVVDGHPYHPNCRSRPGFSAAEQLAYGPEHRPLVELGLVASDDCLVTGEWPKWLRDGERVLIPVHPWQAAHVLRGPGREGTGTEGGLGEGGRSEGRLGMDGLLQEGFAAHPLMSLRTLALPDGPHVKTALSARLTSSVRDISVYSIETAATVSAFMEAMAERADLPLHITRTLGAATANSPDLAAVLRESPDTYANSGERVVPVAALATTGLPRSPAWMAEFTRLALTAGLRLLDMGVALEAHGQNLLVVLSPTGAPLRLVYRDLADIRVSPARLARHGIPVPDLAGRIVTDDETTLRRKLFGALVGGALGATAGSTTALREALETVVPDLPDTPDLAVLRSEPLPTKALTLMRLSPKTPGDTWAQLPNPLLNSSL